MQDSNKISIDARTFTEIWESLDTNTQLDLRDDIVSKVHVTARTVFNWCHGVSPINDHFKKEVSKLLNRSLGLNTYFRTLFPSR